ncbi:F-box/kelch-repeat protein-like [Dorcoceras hygrometricum]|uniref:F-box/kelch-repeat protein-like n=1 Tax=Dorcoceras hygrometricum TaxID=472368 RepID=A0A2Z7C646_9LAMI|nr:F-box/kelch-repeat protein-like [Dorcoceras hygrometricum]
MNPLTNQRVILPPYPIQRGTESARLAFSEASMEYKVVHAFGCQSLDQSMRETHIAVLTVGIDYAWRYIDIQHLSLTSKAVLIMSSPMVTGAFMHWIGTTSVLTLNVETETIREYSLPRLHKESGIFLPMGSNLSIIYEFDAFLRDVWEMNPSTGKWIKLLRFDLRPLSHKSLDLFPPQYFVNPVGWLAVREVLLFNMSGSRTCCVAYNLKTKEIRSFQFDTETESYDFQPHLNSLVLFDGGLQMELQPKRLRVS